MYDWIGVLTAASGFVLPTCDWSWCWLTFRCSAKLDDPCPFDPGDGYYDQ
jgi:hypothetical protein